MLDNKKYNTINVSKNSAYIEKNEGVVNLFQGEQQSLSTEEILLNINNASVDLSSYENTFQGKIHIERGETKELYNWLTSEFNEKNPKIALLVGNAGYGKSVVLKDLFSLLNENGIPSLGIKADKILNISSIKDIETELNLKDNIFSIFQSLSRNKTCAFIIDQIDALSLSLSSSRHAINSYDRLIKQLESLPNVRIVISCRTYDLDYDASLRAYKKNKVINLSLLEIEQVNQVLSDFKINISETNNRLKEFLRIPLHLNLFCKLRITKQFDDTITLQKLYDEIWIEFIEQCISIDSDKLIETLALLARKMNEKQQIVVDKRLFSLYTKELNYLFHSELLKNSASDKIQFIHQTFYDYVYSRTFINSGKSVTDWLKEIHQGLFIRSQTKQIFSYLRDLDHSTYIDEFKILITGKEYRFHLKLLLINDLGFYNNPTKQEKNLVIDYIVNDPLLLQIFLESIQSPEWFEFIVSRDEFYRLLRKNDSKIDWIITSLCVRIIDQSPQLVIDFLSQHKDKVNIIENTLIQMPESVIHLSFNLYNNTVSEWSDHIKSEYYYLEKVLTSDPDFVISELKKDFNENIVKIDRLSKDYIPGEYAGFKIYSELFDKYPHKAITYFLYVIEKIIEARQYESFYGICSDLAFYLYKPNPDNKEIHKFNDIYDIVLYSIKNNLIDDFLKSRILFLLDSKHSNLVAIGIFYLIQNIEIEHNRTYNLFTSHDFLLKIKASEMLYYYSNELLFKVYPFLSNKEQEEINKSILSTIRLFNHWSIKVDYSEKKVYTNYLKITYELVSMIPCKFLDEHKELKKIYQEGYRKYKKVENTPPQEITTTYGWKTYGDTAYEKMSLNDWRNTFLTLNKEQYSFDDRNKPTKEGNKRKFEDYVAKDPVKFFLFIAEIVDEKEIDIEYLISGLEGLEKGNYSKSDFEDLCLKIIEKREHEFNEVNLSSFLRTLRYAVHGNINLDKRIFDFIKQIIYNYPDRELTSDMIQTDDKGMEVVNAGINSIRGIAVELMVDCYILKQFENEIFETLEFVADNTNEITRSCVIFRGAWLNGLNKERALDLYLRLLRDYNPYLLAIPFHNGHPLLYLMYVNFKKLQPFLSKAITVDVAGKPMAMFLLNAYLHNLPEGYSLLKRLISINSIARQELAWHICAHTLKDERYAPKGWKIIDLLLNFEDEELGIKINRCFFHIPTQINSHLISFLNKYVKSPAGKYRDNDFFDFLRKIIPADPHQALKSFFESKPENFKRDFYDKSPINVLIESYNGIREYEKNNPLLEKTMDMFDSLLKVQGYRSNHLRMFLKELTA
nr:AAA family ATPase [uncultured Macellibacteroides sp.]